MAVFFIGITATAQIDRSKPPKSGPTPEIKLGKPYTFELKNGLEVLVVEDPKLPVITMSLDLDNPPIVEGDKAGVQSLAGSIMGKGTTELSKEEFNEKVEFLGARISVGVGGGFAYTLSKYKDEVFQLFADAALKPNFTQEELDFEKSQLIEGIKSNQNSAAAIAGRVRGALAYGKDHAAGEFATEETVNNVTLADVKKFYNDYFKPSNGYLVISGDIKGKEAKKLVKKYLGDWEAGEAPKPQLPPVTDVDERQINFVDVPNAVQTELAVMMVSDLKMNDPDYYAAVVANYILGGGFGSYLNMNLREENGYTYGARTSLGIGRNYKSTFRATTKVRNEVTDSAVVETMKEIKRIRDEYVDDEMLAQAKAKFLGNFIMQSEDKSVVADRAVRIKTMDLPEDFYKNFIKNINAVTKEDVKRVANKYIKPEKARIVLVGKASDVLENLEKMQIDGRPVPIKFYDKEANEIERPSTVEVPAGLTAQDVLDSYISAIGGMDAVQKIKSTSMMAIFSTPRGELVLGSKMANNDQSVMTMKQGGMMLNKQVYNKGKGSVGGMMAGGTKELSGEELEKAKRDSAIFPEVTYAADAELVGAEKMEESNVYEIKWDDSNSSFYDIQSGLKIADKSSQESPQGEIVTITKYQDYQEKEGVKFPMTIVYSVMGQNLTFEVKEFMVNPKLTDKDFE